MRGDSRVLEIWKIWNDKWIKWETKLNSDMDFQISPSDREIKFQQTEFNLVSKQGWSAFVCGSSFHIFLCQMAKYMVHLGSVAQKLEHYKLSIKIPSLSSSKIVQLMVYNQLKFRHKFIFSSHVTVRFVLFSRATTTSVNTTKWSISGRTKMLFPEITKNFPGQFIWTGRNNPPWKLKSLVENILLCFEQSLLNY